MTKKILICGDSFSADWSKKHDDYKGWPTLLEDIYDVTNISQAGCSEYKIWKQLNSADLSNFDHVILSHTSPFRLPVESHPDYNNDSLHKDCDLIYSDVKHSANKSLQCVVGYFEKFFLPEYAIFVHKLIIGHQIQHLHSFKGSVLHLKTLEQDFDFSGQTVISFEKTFQKHCGLINHFTEKGNQIVFDTINKELL